MKDKLSTITAQLAWIIFFLLLITVSTCNPAHANFIPDTTEKVNLLADAIYHAEGGDETSFPFGIKSVRCEGYAECRKVCKMTISNNVTRYQRTKKYDHYTGSYLTFLGSRYCPVGESCTHWKYNVKWFLNNPKGIE